MTPRLDRAGIAALIPHEGSMCLLDAVLCLGRHDHHLRRIQPSVD